MKVFELPPFFRANSLPKIRFLRWYLLSLWRKRAPGRYLGATVSILKIKTKEIWQIV